MKKEIKIGLLGCGTVGSGVYKILEQNAESIANKSGAKLVVKKVLVKDKNEPLAVDVDKNLLTENFEDVINDDEIEIIIEVIGGVNPAKDFVLRSLESGRSVISANKELIAKHGEEILATADENSVDFYFEASVGGGIPIISPLKESLAGNKITKVMGIVNGTTNYILTKMDQEGAEFDQVLKKAQELGYAEADPTSDIEGYDAAYKLAILASIAFESRVNIEDVYMEGITKITKEDITYAKELGYKIKLLAIGKQNDGVELRVHPTLLPQEHPIAKVDDVFNAIFIEGDAIGEAMFYGPGAGQMPTGSAIVGDVIAAARNINFGAQGRIACTCFTQKEIKDRSEVESSFYIRLEVLDRPGVLGEVTSLLGKQSVSLESVIQHGRSNSTVPLVLVTHEVKEGNLNAALEKIKALDDVKEIASLIRVEDYN
ncbi:homoserine dehydrogenase [Orenia metallireducens]|jgi:homoserine dehydrogenase|uniref:Homoserine dehydrogenase n=1 Tax=Orenia metallireducens TaxID=1413210 RepID=A0A285GG03_9FIRM|nr:homoserine dehydrogenase [Orenia metallireducens]PRX30394.1 homoserine dehydrogenase [Orenia metallireducens]SNY22263.1 homoserine dehydrogenase [Orenia metallireducens]